MRPGRPDVDLPPPSLTPETGWHCSHYFYRFDRKGLPELKQDLAAAREEFVATLDPAGPGACQRIQVSLVAGHKADFSLMLLDPDPLRIEGTNQRLLSGGMGAALVPVYSFVSMSEISEYVQTVDQFRDKLIAEGLSADSEALRARVQAYADREPAMRRQRLTPDFPNWPATCFYPMNKIREPGANWFMLPFSERSRMMIEHGTSGMAFAGKVTQLITVAVGLDDWEWGVTLWARNPQFLKDIVYKMRFDEASARYAEFGPFFTSYICSAAQLCDHCRIGG